MRYFGIVLLFFIAWSSAKANQFMYVFENKQHWLILDGVRKKIEVSRSSGLLVLKRSISIENQKKIQASYLLSQKPIDDLEKIFIKSDFSSSLKDINLFVDLVQGLCFYQKDKKCFYDLDLFIKQKIKNKNKTLLALNQLQLGRMENDWKKQRLHFEKAISLDPSNEKIKYYSRLFSIEMGLQVIKFYRQEIERNGFYTALGLSTAKDGQFTLIDSFVETVMNTYNVSRLISSEYFGDKFLDDLKNKFLICLKDLNDRELKLLKIKKDLNLTEDYHRSDEIISRHLGDNDRASLFFESVMVNGLYSNSRGADILFPVISQFKIRHVNVFANPELKQLLLEQLSFLNFFMLVRGPAMVRKFGQTKIGISLVEKLKLKPLVDNMAKLKWPLNSLLVWVALETADGCLIRYAYVFYTVGSEVSDESKQEIEDFMKSF